MSFEQIAPCSIQYFKQELFFLNSDLLNLVSRRPGGKPMKASTVNSFSKKLTCPTSNLLLSFQQQALAPEINLMVNHHLAVCDFCYCEIALLTFYKQPLKGESRPPELPINLRVLAESILGPGKSPKVVAEMSAEG